ncbi:hypothetical protein LTR64_007094 [Lithohypha guttulata]|uniref:uncharacterized protein n=1 Tax=Lithohypha guttulata TaxID=1690604 RepID=UPI002DDF6D97|nr:hypothetical protein LTR51_004350 [Lithohypha guttulata]
MTTTPIRLGFIGASTGKSGPGSESWAVRAHVPFLKSSRNTSYTITAIQNSTRQSAENAASSLQLSDVKGFYDNPHDLAKDENVDVVAVSVNVPSHYDTVMPALNAGKDIFVEWPLGRNLKEAQEMTTLAKQKGVRTMVGLQARQNPSVVAAKRLVDDGSVGEILSTTMHGYGMIFGATTLKSFAYGFPIEAGANLLTIPFGHAVDAMCWVLGEMEYVSATLANRRPKFEVTDHAGEVMGEATKTAHDHVAVTGVLERSGGVVNLMYEGGMNPSGGPSFFWQINGTKGTLLLEGHMGHLQMFQPKISFAKVGEEIKEVEGVKKVDADFSYAVGEAWEAFAGKGGGTVTTFEDALTRHQMINAIYRSNESGERESYMRG